MSGSYNWIRGGGLAGMLALPFTVLAVALLQRRYPAGDLDLRAGAFPWLAAAVAILLMMCLNGLRHYHGPRASRLLGVAVALTSVGLIGMFALFGGMAGSAVFGINARPILLLGMLIIILMAVIGLPVGLVLLGIATLRQRLLPRALCGIPLLLAALIPGGMMGVGFVNNVAAESIIGILWFVAFAVGWAVLGYRLWKPGTGSRGRKQV